MAITLNSVSQAGTSGSASFSVAHTVNSGANRLMLVFVECPNSTDYMASGTVSYGGTSLGSAVVIPPASPALALFTYVYRMIAPPVGTANVVVTPSTTAFLNVKVITLDGVDQATPISTSNAARLGFAPGSSYSLPITAPSGGVAVGSFSCRNTSSAIAAINGGTELGTITSTTASRMIASIKDSATSLDYSFTGSQPSLAASAVSLNAATGGGTPVAFTGTIPNQSATVGVPFSLDVASYYTGTLTPFTYALATGDLTGTGLSRAGSVISGTPTSASTISGLSISATDTGSNVATSNTFNIVVAAGGDTTPPTFTVAPAVTSISTTTATVTATINETGNIYHVIVPQADATPSVAQVKAGQNSAGGSPVESGSALATTTISDPASGLTADTPYKMCMVAEDDESPPNIQAAVTTVNFTTSAVAVGTITSQPLSRNNGIGSGVVALTYIDVDNPATGALVLRKTGVSTNSSGVFTFSDASITTGTEYRITWLEAGGQFGTAFAVAS